MSLPYHFINKFYILSYFYKINLNVIFITLELILKLQNNLDYLMIIYSKTFIKLSIVCVNEIILQLFVKHLQNASFIFQISQNY